jgi:hypothetical protein
MQGVELYQLGQGGSIGHYPVHFHLARVTAPATKSDGSARETFVKDCSIWDSMTRFITLHATQDVTLARNVGYESIGHGYYLEDGSEIDNKLYSNIGILSRAGVINPAQNPRFVPGILALDSAPGDNFPFRSDWQQPTVFWIMNGWNDIQDNMAAGADTCGACYWWVPAQNSGFSLGMKWDGYAAIQQGRDMTSPLEQFYQNYCTSAMNSLLQLGLPTPVMESENRILLTSIWFLFRTRKRLNNCRAIIPRSTARGDVRPHAAPQEKTAPMTW